MKAHTKHQVIEHQGEPVAVVVPYDEYLKLCKAEEQQYTIPHEIIESRVLNNYTSVKAWRLYRKLTQAEAAEQMGISQPAYNQMEKRPFYKARKETQRKLCQIFDVLPAMMADFDEIEL